LFSPCVSHFIVDLWSKDLLGKIVELLLRCNDQNEIKYCSPLVPLLDENQIGSDVDLNPMKQLPAPEILISMIGPQLWQKHWHGYYQSEKLSGLKQINLGPAVTMEPTTLAEVPVTGVGKRRTAQVTSAGRLSANALFDELSKADLDEHFLIDPYDYGEVLSPVERAVQPFRIEVHPQVGFLTDVHSHLCDSEVIGLLAGKWDRDKRCLYIQAPFPCAATERHKDDFGFTDVELDSEAEWKVRETISRLGLQVVGWYHSHPKFKPDPSVMDVFNQQQYQLYTRDSDLGIEPFVGLIVSTFDPRLANAHAHHQWFTVVPYAQQPFAAITTVAAVVASNAAAVAGEGEHYEFGEEEKEENIGGGGGASSERSKGIEYGTPVVHPTEDVRYMPVRMSVSYNKVCLSQALVERSPFTVDAAGTECSTCTGFCRENCPQYAMPMLNVLNELGTIMQSSATVTEIDLVPSSDVTGSVGQEPMHASEPSQDIVEVKEEKHVFQNDAKEEEASKSNNLQELMPSMVSSQTRMEEGVRENVSGSPAQGTEESYWLNGVPTAVVESSSNGVQSVATKKSIVEEAVPFTLLSVFSGAPRPLSRLNGLIGADGADGSGDRDSDNDNDSLSGDVIRSEHSFSSVDVFMQRAAGNVDTGYSCDNAAGGASMPISDNEQEGFPENSTSSPVLSKSILASADTMEVNKEKENNSDEQLWGVSKESSSIEPSAPDTAAQVCGFIGVEVTTVDLQTEPPALKLAENSSSAASGRRSGRELKARDKFGEFVDSLTIDRKLLRKQNMVKVRESMLLEKEEKQKQKKKNAAADVEKGDEGDEGTEAAGQLPELDVQKKKRGRKAAVAVAVAVAKEVSVILPAKGNGVGRPSCAHCVSAKNGKGVKGKGGENASGGEGNQDSMLFCTHIRKPAVSTKKQLSGSSAELSTGGDIGGTGAGKGKSGRKGQGKDVSNQLVDGIKMSQTNGNNSANNTTESAAEVSVPVNTVRNSILMALQEKDSPSAALARSMLSSVVPPYRGLVLVLISMGFYYSRSPRRVDLAKKWKTYTKIDKIRASAEQWVTLLGLQETQIAASSSAQNDDVSAVVAASSSSMDNITTVDGNAAVKDSEEEESLSFQPSKLVSASGETTKFQLVDYMVKFLTLCWETSTKSARKRKNSM
jgi:proteasome lid subunit RPN8/RPN11